MIEFFKSLPELMQIYLILGFLVYLFTWKKYAYRAANSISGSISGHPVSSFRDQGNEPTLFHYIIHLGWLPAIVGGWPFVILYFKLFSKDGK